MSTNSGDSNSNSNSVSSQNLIQTSRGTGTTTTSPFNSQQILGALNTAENLYGGMAQPGANAAGAGLAGINGAVGASNPLFGAGNTALASTLSGQYLQPQGSNPFLDPTFQHASDMLEGQSRSAWGGQDTIPGTSGMQQAALANAQGNLANQIYGGNYQQERTNQLGAAGMLPSYVSGSLVPGQAQMAAGYSPMQQYISALGAISPGSTSTLSKDMTATSQGTTSSTGGSTGSSKSNGLNLL